MTGLDPDTDRLLEIAVIITNGRLEPVDEGIEYIIKTPKPVLDRYVSLLLPRLYHVLSSPWTSSHLA